MIKMFKFILSDRLSKKLSKLNKRDKILAKIFGKKLVEVINHDKKTINTYKNLKSPKNEYKRIHLTDNYILFFHVNTEKNLITFVDIMHWDHAYR